LIDEDWVQQTFQFAASPAKGPWRSHQQTGKFAVQFSEGETALITIQREPVVSVGLISGIEKLSFDLHGEYQAQDGTRFAAGSYQALASGTQRVEIKDESGRTCVVSAEFMLSPCQTLTGSFTVRDVTIGIDFHWQRKQDQQFRGALRLKPNARGRLIVINEIAVEAYLTSVISSEMSATCHPELLKAHAIISRSWLLAQLKPWKVERSCASLPGDPSPDAQRLIRWYSQESHTDFDVCADDHCQRYQGITKATSPSVFAAIGATYGRVLVAGDELCDARFSKSCGGMTEEFSAAWEDESLSYLAARYDGETFPAGFQLPLTIEANAAHWIQSSPPAFCNTSDRTILRRILPDFDQETEDFYRWRVKVEQEELQRLLQTKLGIDFGPIKKLEPVERGHSGRLVRLRIVGEREALIIGKELEIRRALSPSHLFSSAFVAEAGTLRSGVPESFTLLGAGWGHGVGLCQIGAAIMAERGYDYQQILAHYYTGSGLHELYPQVF
jgi:SpoIID/LytB domain protein